MANQFDAGIGLFARQQWSTGRQTPHAQQQSPGIHIATVVDDICEKNMGTVWGYIPGISAPNQNIRIARYSPARNPPAANGTPGTPIESMRQGFIKCYPLSPTAGSDRLREQANTPDGRNPGQGQSNGYGMFNQARNGDMIAVCFIDGDPSRAYIIGHVPKIAETDHVPSYGPQKTANTMSGSGTTTSTTPNVGARMVVAPANQSGSGYSTNIGPAYNYGIDTTIFASTTAFNNATDAGTIADPLRGPGSSSSTRETPSRVWGVKTPGDPDTNMMGHQLVMDDSPNSQLMRFRTSKGTQVLLCDNGDFVYISTATGKTWIQIDGGGNVNVYAKSGVSIHSEHDFNLTCDRDFNLNVGGNLNWIVEGNSFIRMNKGGNITVGEGGGDLDITAINNMMFKVQGEFRLGAQNGITAKSAMFIGLQATQNITMKTAAQLDVQTTSDADFKIGGKFQVNGTGDVNFDTGGNLNMTKRTLSLSDVADSTDPNQASMPTQYSVTAPPQTSGPPISPTAMLQTAAAIVPQSEPWPHHPGQAPGFNAAINPASIPSLVSS